MDQARVIEVLVAKLERSLGKAEVQWNIRLPDKATGKPRQIDVLVTMKDAYRHTRLMYEVKHQARPVDVPVLEALATKRDALPVDKVFLVSTSGFTDACPAKATSLGIELMHLQPGEMDAPRMHVTDARFRIRRCELVRLDLGTNPKRGHLDDRAIQLISRTKADRVMVRADGAEATLQAIADKAGDELRADLPEEPIESREASVPLATPNGRIWAKGSKLGVRVESLTLVFRLYEDVGKVEKSEERVYRHGEEVLANVVRAEARVGRTVFNLEFIGKKMPDGSLAVVPYASFHEDRNV